LGAAIETRGYQERSCIWGESESGKSELFRSIVERLSAPRCARCVAASAMCEHRGPRPGPPISRVWVFDPAHEHTQPNGGALFRPDFGDPTGVAIDEGEHFDQVNTIAQLACRTGGVTVAVDEAESCCGKNRAPPPWLYEVVKRGRHYPRGAPNAVGFVLCTQTPTDLHPRLLGSLRDLFCFRLTAKAHLDRASSIGLDPQIIRRLDVGQFVHWRRGHEPHTHRPTLAGWDPCPAAKKTESSHDR